ncbi:MAG: DHH family phosphoesterase [Candidatus Aenigmarchaeota archaeon]|nr:DHH family phosphoesterase [Candidatus Aenigmarchaeota archaeon]
MNLYEKAAEFLNSIEPKHGVIIVYNNDMDGMASCTMMKKYLEKKGNKPYIIFQPMPPEKNFLRRVQTSLPDFIIFVDMAMDSEPNIIKKLKGIAQILVIDHHVIVRDLNSHGILHLNPRFENPKTYQSASYLVYSLLSTMKEEPDEWIAMLGVVGDYVLDDSKDVVKKALKIAPIETYRFVCGSVEAARVSKRFSCDQIVDIIISSNSIDDLAQKRDFIEAAAIVEGEIQKEMSNASENMEIHGNIILYHCASKYSIRSNIATMISEKNPGKIVIAYGSHGKNVVGSVRTKGKMNTVNILKKAFAGAKNASYGGHEAASGFSVPEMKWKDFKDNLIKAAEGY